MKTKTTQTERCLYKTTDYDSIKHITGNRQINPQNVERLKISMGEKQLITAAVVNDKMEIIDGQHRHEACRQLNLPFYYYIVDDYRLDDVQRMNSNMKNWTLADFHDTYIELYNSGDKDYVAYVELKLFMDEYAISLQTALYLANTKIAKGVYETSFKSGGFKFRNKNIAGLIIEEMVELFQGFDEKIWKPITFVKEYSKLYLYNDYEFTTMLKKTQSLAAGVKQNSLPFHELKGGATILNGLVEAYNHRSPRGSRISTTDVNYYYSDYQKGK